MPTLMLAVFWLFAWFSVVINADEDVFGGKLLLAASSKSSALLPLIQRPAKGDSDLSGQSKLIRGLLERQFVCYNQGYGECPNIPRQCCPVGGQCCTGSGGYCCNAGKWCYGGGCCSSSQRGCENNSCCNPSEECCKGGGCCASGNYCAVANGKAGCCPNGQTCSGGGGGGGTCEDSGYVPCTNYALCCPSGYTCYRDSGGNGRCSAPGSNPSPTDINPGSDANPGTTTYPTDYTTPPSLTNSTSATPSIATTVPSPVPSQGTTNTDVSVTDSRIQYSGDGWTAGTSPCNSTATTKKCSGPSHSVTFTFEALAVYMRVTSSSDAGTYSVYYEGDTVTLDGYSASTSCGFTWSKTNVGTGLQTLTITVMGQSSLASTSTLGLFELAGFMIVESDSSQGPSATAGSSSNGSRITKAVSLRGAMMALIAMLFQL